MHLGTISISWSMMGIFSNQVHVVSDIRPPSAILIKLNVDNTADPFLQLDDVSIDTRSSGVGAAVAPAHDT